MSSAPTIQRSRRWPYLAAITAAIHASIFFSPIPIVELRSGDPAYRQYLLLLVPAIWSIFIFLRYRHPSERNVAYVSLAVTVLEFLSVGNIRT